MSVLVRLGLVMILFSLAGFICNAIEDIGLDFGTAMLGMFLVGAVLFIFPKWKD